MRIGQRPVNGLASVQHKIEFGVDDLIGNRVVSKHSRGLNALCSVSPFATRLLPAEKSDRLIKKNAGLRFA